MVCIIPKLSLFRYNNYLATISYVYYNIMWMIMEQMKTWIIEICWKYFNNTFIKKTQNIIKAFFCFEIIYSEQKKRVIFCFVTICTIIRKETEIKNTYVILVIVYLFIHQSRYTIYNTAFKLILESNILQNKNVF